MTINISSLGRYVEFVDVRETLFICWRCDTSGRAGVSRFHLPKPQHEAVGVCFVVSASRCRTLHISIDSVIINSVINHQSRVVLLLILYFVLVMLL